MTATRRFGTAALAAATLASTVALASVTQEDARKTAAEDQMVDGVVTDVAQEKSGDGRKSGAYRITLNTAAVWRDYARDTATEGGTSASQAAEKGDQSVATKGQPEDRNTALEVDLPAATRAELRYRSQMDETSLGAPTADEARELARRDPQAGDRPKSGGEPDRRRGKPFELDGLRNGLWIKLYYQRDGARNVGTRLIVLEPVRDTASTADPREP
jgi:hypothetical protein